MNTDYPAIKERIISFITSSVQKSETSGAVIGLSGGIDSTLIAYLTAEAIGSDNVLGLLLPEKGMTSEQDINDALHIVKILGIEHKVIEITPVLQSFSKSIPDFNKNARHAAGNLKARTRMCMLYYHANIMHRLVVGTGNRTELLLGYFTKFGDGGVDIEPIGSLYKTQVRGLARHIGIPAGIINKIPTAGLWKGQTDEGELGVSYDNADKILSMLVDEKKDISIIKKSFSPGIVDMIAARITSNEHKRKPPESCEL